MIVVANGCVDDTEAVVGRFPWCRLVSIDVASKPAALNAGDAAAKAAARVYLDADVSISDTTLRALIEAIGTAEPIVASPPVRIDQRAATVPARAYQRVWSLTDYRMLDHTGSGVYAVSASGRARFERFPDIVSDDLWVRLLFDADQRRVTEGPPFTIHAPRTLRAQLKRLSRTMAGEMQVARLYPQLQPSGSLRRSRGRLLGRVARRPALWPAFLVYAGTYAAARWRARMKLERGRMHVWERDLTTR